MPAERLGAQAGCRAVEEQLDEVCLRTLSFGACVVMIVSLPSPSRSPLGSRLEGYLLPQVAGEPGSMATTFINANRTLPQGERTLSTGQLTHIVTIADPSAFRYHSCCLLKDDPDRCYLLD